MPLVGNLLSKRALVALPPTSTAKEAAAVMAREKVGAILVTEDGKLLGIFTERDLMVRVVVPELDLGKVQLSEVMSAELYTAHPGHKVAAVREEMHKRHIRHVPVVQDGRVVGMLSLRDLLRADLANKTHEVEAITAYIQGFEGSATEGGGDAGGEDQAS